jgi:polysaccharide pyruvyl transferase WcaK-like protein
MLQPRHFPYPSEIEYVGINVSPLVIKQETSHDVLINSFVRLIKYIIEETDYGVLLLPHVIWKSNDDREPLSLLFHSFAGTGRVFIIDDCNCMEMKGYISKCRFLVAARTHASIAGYSQSIPTMVIGYSVKSTGIARDIFGNDNPYVIPVQDIKDPDDLITRFRWLQKNEQPIIDHMRAFIPQYAESTSKVHKLIGLSE